MQRRTEKAPTFSGSELLFSTEKTNMKYPSFHTYMKQEPNSSKVNFQSVAVFIPPPLMLVAQGYDLKISYETGHLGAVISHLDLLLYIYSTPKLGVLHHLIYGIKN